MQSCTHPVHASSVPSALVCWGSCCVCCSGNLGFAEAQVEPLTAASLGYEHDLHTFQHVCSDGSFLLMRDALMLIWHTSARLEPRIC